MSVERVPLRVPHSRRSIKLRGFDYSREGVYFVTVCVQMGNHMFGDVVEGKVRLNAAGQAATKCWLEIPTHFPRVRRDAFIVMPNHLHGIVAIHDDGATLRDDGDTISVGAQHAAPLPLRRHASLNPDVIHDAGDTLRVGAQHAAPLPLRPHASVGPHGSGGAASIRVSRGSLGAIVRCFKSATTKRINELRQTPGDSVWQRNYYDRIIRNDRELDRARRYIMSNPARWIARGSS